MPDSSPSSRTVYAVSSGSYSDYTVDCVFERREDAERYVELKMGERVEEMTYFAEFPAVHRKYSATVYKQGGMWGQAGAMRLEDWMTTDEPEHRYADSNFAVTAEGPDKERVIKSVRDRYATWKAEQEGVS